MTDEDVSGDGALLPDCGGLIEELAITLPGKAFDLSNPERLRAYRNLIASLPAEIVLKVIVDGKSVDDLRRFLDGFEHRCVVDTVAVSGGGELRSSDFWTQDPFLVRVRGRDRTFVQMTDGHGGRHAEWMRSAAASVRRDAHMSLDGGNCLVGDNFRIVGASSIDRTVRLLPGRHSLQEAYRAHRDFDARRLAVFGYLEAELCQSHEVHNCFDMACLATCGGGEDLPKRIAQYPFHVDHAVSVTGLRDDEGRPILLVADPRLSADPSGPEEGSAARRLNASIARLRQDGFHILRNPVPVLPLGANLPAPSHSAVSKWRLYNNVMVENAPRPGEAKPFVWLPIFADAEPELETFDDVNRGLWEDLGFKVLAIGGWSHLASGLGALRCATKVLKRGPWQPELSGHLSGQPDFSPSSGQ